ncbi:MAG: SDR family NAD(P)-dependent oxidoreductase [Gammaproteobacteria bacterium]
MSDNTDMKGKVALVTGAASGIGASTMQLLAKRGATVVGTDLQHEKGMELVRKIEATGGSALFLEQDVTDEGNWDAVVNHIMDRYGELHVLVNNAGIGVGGDLLEFTLEQWRELFAVNVEGVFLGTRYCLPHLAASGSGSIVHISSVAGLEGMGNLSAYCATKGAVRLFSKAVAKECAGKQMPVRSNSVHPGIIDTPIWAPLLDDESLRANMSQLGNEVSVQGVAALSVPGGQAGTPDQVAEVIAFLASDASSYVSGGEFTVDYGLSS